MSLCQQPSIVQHGVDCELGYARSTMAALLQPYCEDALGKAEQTEPREPLACLWPLQVVDARTPGLVSLSFPPSEAGSQLCATSTTCLELQDVEPQPTEDYILASFYSTWRRRHAIAANHTRPCRSFSA